MSSRDEIDYLATTNDQLTYCLINARERQKSSLHKALVIWFTGLSGSGKTSMAQQIEYRLLKMGFNVFLLDGDIVRQGLCSDLGFSEEDRNENIRRIAHTAKILFDAGLIVLVSAISPYERDRQFARSLIDPQQFLEIYMSTPLHICEERDPKGLYKQARSGKIINFTGVGSNYEVPATPDFCINTEIEDTTEELELLLSTIRERCCLYRFV